MIPATIEYNDFKSDNHEVFNKEVADKDLEDDDIILTKHVGTDYSYKHKLVWTNAIGFFILNCLWVWSIFVFASGEPKYQTYIWSFVVLFASGLGVTVGAHRLFAHKCFKVHPVVKAILITLHTIAGQNSLYIWCRDHRLHHRYSDTDADPHNSNRGFFFSHIGWLMYKKHPYVKKLGKKIDMSDLETDWMVMFQHKYYYVLYMIFALLIPVFGPYYFWGETLKNSLLICYIFRYLAQLNATWCVNSAAHLYGTRPYNKKIQPVDSWFVSVVALGEGWHNYHHTFPWDYKAAELSTLINPSARVIEFLHKFGLAYDLKAATTDMVKRRILKSGDGTHFALGNDKDKQAVTAIGPVHPLNPSYNVKYKTPEPMLKAESHPLCNENDVIKTNLSKRDVANA